MSLLWQDAHRRDFPSNRPKASKKCQGNKSTSRHKRQPNPCQRDLPRRPSCLFAPRDGLAKEPHRKHEPHKGATRLRGNERALTTALPVNVSVSARAIVTAGLAKLVDAVNQ